MPRPFLDHRRSSLHQVVLPAPYKSASQFLGWGRFWFHMSILRFHQFFLARRMLEDLMRPWVGKMAWNCVEPWAACPLNIGCVEAIGQIYSDFLFAICIYLWQLLKLAIVGVMPSSGRCSVPSSDIEGMVDQILPRRRLFGSPAFVARKVHHFHFVTTCYVHKAKKACHFSGQNPRVSIRINAATLTATNPLWNRLK